MWPQLEWANRKTEGCCAFDEMSERCARREAEHSHRGLYGFDLRADERRGEALRIEQGAGVFVEFNAGRLELPKEFDLAHAAHVEASTNELTAHRAPSHGTANGMGPNVRHERRPRGRAADSETAARWRC